MSDLKTDNLGGNMEIAAEIQRLKQLHDQGALTDEEFGAAKMQILTYSASQPSGDSGKNSVGRAANNFVKFVIGGGVVSFVIAIIFFFTFWLPQWQKISAQSDEMNRQHEIFSRQVEKDIADSQKDMKKRSEEFDKNFKKQSEEMDQFRKKNGLN